MVCKKGEIIKNCNHIYSKCQKNNKTLDEFAELFKEEIGLIL